MIYAWSIEHSGETTAPAEAIWSLWADVPGWREWNPDIERVEITGPFAGGTTFTMTPIGGDPVELRIAEATAPARFVDEAVLGDVVVRTEHRVEPAGERNRVVYRMEVSGPGAEEIGPQISGDFPETIAALIARAEG